MIPGGYYSHNIPPAKHNKGAVIQVIDQKGALYRSDGEFWVPLAAVEAPAGSTFLTATTSDGGIPFSGFVSITDAGYSALATKNPGTIYLTDTGKMYQGATPISGGGSASLSVTNGVMYRSDSASLILRAAIAKAIAGQSDVRIVAQGDSISSDAYTGGDDHYAVRLAKNLSNKTGLPVGLGYIPFASTATAGTNKGRNLVVRGAGWTNYNGFAVFGAQDAIKATAGVTTSLDVTIPEICDSVNLVCMVGSAVGPVRCSWNADGIGAAQTIAVPSGTVTYGLISVPAPTRASGHVLHLWTSASGNTPIYWGVEPQDSQIKKIRPFAAGKSSQCLSAVENLYRLQATAKAALNAMSPDLFVLEIGANDVAQNAGYTSGDAWKSLLDSLYTIVRSISKPMTCAYVAPPNFATSAGMTPSIEDFLAVALAYCQAADIPVYSTSRQQGAYATANAAGLYYDSIHPSVTGSVLMGDGIAEAVF